MMIMASGSASAEQSDYGDILRISRTEISSRQG
jgi:hypothetical protein